jgi:hypothetical protein
MRAHIESSTPTRFKMGDSNGVKFHFRIRNGDTLMLSPVLSKAMIHKTLADLAKFSDAWWAVSVAYAGHTWKRVPCGQWWGMDPLGSDPLPMQVRGARTSS